MKGRFVRIAGSWWLTVLLFLYLVVSYLYFSFGDYPFRSWMDFLLRSPIGAASYVMIAINLTASTIRIISRRLSDVVEGPQDISRMDAKTEIPVLVSGDLYKVSVWLQSQGYRGRLVENSFLSVRGRLSFLPGAVLRTGCVILLLSVFFSAHLRKSAILTMHEGEVRDSLGEEVRLVSIEADLPESFLQIGEEGSFRLNEVSASISHAGKIKTVTPAFPSGIGSRYFRITEFGFSHPFYLGGVSSREEILDLQVLPPGKSDKVLSASGKTTLVFTMLPEKTITKGLFSGKEYSLKEPLYRILVQKEGSGPETLVLKPGERLKRPGSDVSIGKRSLFVKIQAVRDPMLPFLYAGFILVLAGSVMMLSRFFWYEKRLAVVQEGQLLHVGCSEEFYRKWTIEKFEHLKKSLAEYMEQKDRG